VSRRGSAVVAEFTNEHAAYFLLTRDQLCLALNSGGFMRAPYQGRYDMLVTAATDPYTSCGFHKVICVSEWESFLIHHASNRYAGSWGVTCEAFQEQIEALMEIANGRRPVKTLCEVEPLVLHNWGKSFYEKPSLEWLNAVPVEAREILSIGSGWGAFEQELHRRGAVVTALALDSVIGAAAEKRGIPVVYETLDDGLGMMRSRKFDCIIISNLLHLLRNPARVIEASSRLVRSGGQLMLTGPNFKRFPILVKRLLSKGDYGKLRSYADSGINVCGPSDVSKMLSKSDLRVDAVHWLNHIGFPRNQGRLALQLGFLTARDWMLVAKNS
jgi:2-polyprenyl-3-methyl-5-hydroxy-6-metoxy-1,4-benzoquinol methylase